MRQFLVSTLLIVCVGFSFFIPVHASEPDNEKTNQLNETDPYQERYDKWSDQYFEQWDQWFDELAFDTEFYFHEPEQDDLLKGQPTQNLIDVYYEQSLRKYISAWAFAIEMIGKDGRTACLYEDCKPVLRMVSVNENRDAVADQAMPESKEETAQQLAAQMHWREANLRQCKGAVEHLIAFERKEKKLWPENYQEWLLGNVPDAPEIFIVRGDGDWLSLRAGSRENPEATDLSGMTIGLTVDLVSEGFYYDWALKMKEIVKPCLKPSTAKPPWEKALALKDKSSK